MAELDDAYANGAYIPGAQAYPARWAAEAEAFRVGLGGRAELGVSYGDTERQAFDVFHPEGDARGTLVFVHGGYWLKFDRSYWSHLAQGAVTRGWTVVMPSYDLCPAVRIAEITAQIARCIERAGTLLHGPISLAGHSAGGHLVARMLAPGQLSAPLHARLTAVAPISPVSDLRPLLQTSMNSEFRLDLAAAEAESPVLQPTPDVPVEVWVGADERPAFLDQARWLADAWNCGHVVVPGTHHFDVIDALGDADSDLVATLTRGA